MNTPSFFLTLLLTFGSFRAPAQTTISLKNYTSPLRFRQVPILPRNFYNQHLGFFCKREIGLQQRTGVNLFVRLGSKSYVDYLERKPNALAGLR